MFYVELEFCKKIEVNVSGVFQTAKDVDEILGVMIGYSELVNVSVLDFKTILHRIPESCTILYIIAHSCTELNILSQTWKDLY